MEKLEIDFSEKNIPLCSLWSYKRNLLMDIERFKENLRWRVFFFKHPKHINKRESYGLRTRKQAPSDADLEEFERRLYEMISQVKFRKIRKSKLMYKMENIIKDIRAKNMITVRSDKTNNLFLLKPEEYYELLNRELNKQYKKDNNNVVGNKINDNAKRIGGDLGIDDRMETLRKDECYLLLKDHKPTFYREKQARLINQLRTKWV